MKKTLKIFAAGALAATWVSCSFLDVEPKIINPDNFYSTEKEVAMGLAGAYGPMGQQDFYGIGYNVFLSGVDDLCYQNRNATASEQVFYFTATPSNTNITDTWKSIYLGIKNANEFMMAIADSTFDPAKRYYGEARFLRAYYHFLLAQAWGAVPLRDQPTKSPETSQTNLAATPQADVLQWCIDEMEACLLYEGFSEANISVGEQPSRVERTTIQGILARVCLFMAGESLTGIDKQAMWDKAAYYAKAVIDSGLHELNPSYSELFIGMIEDEYDPYRESMWEAEFLGDRSSASEWSNGRIGDIIGLQSSNASDTDFGQWTCNYSYGMYNGSLKLWDLYWQTDRTDEEKASTTAITDERQAWNLPNYNYAGNNALGLVASYDKTPYPTGVTGVTTFDDITLAAGIRNAGKWRREAIYEGHMKAKSLYTRINFPILRYSDVLLMYAEAANEQNGAPTEELYNYVKQVRDRAGIATLPYSEYGDFTAFREWVRNERARELCFEGLRKYDLIRWGEFYYAVRAYQTAVTDSRWGPPSNNATLSATATGKNVQQKHIYQPIPTAELQSNALMRQNSMW